MIRLPGLKKADRVSPDDMSMTEHLVELRARIIKSLYVLLAGMIIVWVFNEPIFELLTEPYCDIRAESGQDCLFQLKEPLTAFNVQLTIAGYGGFVLALPFILYQLARFVLPGLSKKERRILLPFIGSVIVFLLMGMYVAYWFMPRALDVLVNDFGGSRYETFFEPGFYLEFFVKMVLAFGLMFQTPVVLVFLQAVGVVETATLRKNRRFAIIACVIAGAVVTPTGDPINLAIMVVPMYLFYELAMVIGALITRRRAKAG